MDALDYIIQNNEELEDKNTEMFSFKWLAKLIIRRQKLDKDTIIVVTGERRMGKSNWLLKLMNAFIKEKRKENPNYKWSFNKNFPLTREEAIDKVEKIPDESFIFYDEGGDIAYSSDTLNAMNKRLVKFMAKSGKKRLLTLIALPDVFMLDKKILNMALFLVAVPYRYRDVCSFAFIYGRNPNPFIQDKFGLEYIKRMFAGRRASTSSRMPTLSGTYSIKRKVDGVDTTIKVPYPRDLFNFMRSLPTFLHYHRFGRVCKVTEDRYIRKVKMRQIFIQDKFGFVKTSIHRKVCEKYHTLLYNLYYKMDLSYAQIERLHLNEQGKRLTGAVTIKKKIENLTAKWGEENETEEKEALL